MKYTVVFEKTDNNLAAYVPDLPGCVATGSSREEVQGLIRTAIGMHLSALREYGEPEPNPEAWAELVEV